MSSIQHYAHVALHAPVQCQSMRLAHNDCKKKLIYRALDVSKCSLHNCSVLDIACGRGGDLNKLQGCKSYVGIDNCPGALAELERRASELKMPVTVHCDDVFNVPVTMQCNLVLCNFAIHYFCDTLDHMKALLTTVSKNLKPGGAFCGTFERTTGTVGWGVPYHAVVGDCVNALEWRVPWPAIVNLALQKDMALVHAVPFYATNRQSDFKIIGFIFQKAQVQCCDKKETSSR